MRGARCSGDRKPYAVEAADSVEGLADLGELGASAAGLGLDSVAADFVSMAALSLLGVASAVAALLLPLLLSVT